MKNQSGCLLLLIALILTGLILTPVISRWVDNQIAAVGAARAAQAWARAQAEIARTEQEKARAAEAWARTAAVSAQQPQRQAALTTWLIAAGVILLLVLLGFCAVVIWRAALIYPDERGLYPIIPAAIPARSVNEPGAQSLAIAPRAAVQILPPAITTPPPPEIPEPVILEGKRLAHIERLLLTPRSNNDDPINL